jgi:hypothetical protein
MKDTATISILIDKGIFDKKEPLTKNELRKINEALNKCCSTIENIGYVNAQLFLDNNPISYDDIEEME